MNKKSLEKEFKRFKSYLKSVKIGPAPATKDESRIISYTLEGMIMTLHNLIKTGAYDQYEDSSDTLFNLVSQARHTAIHYGYFNDLNTIFSQAQEIVSIIPDDLKSNFATLLPALTFYDDSEYFELSSTDKTEIKEAYSPDGYFVFRSLRSKEEFYVKKEDLIIIENQINHHSSYLIKSSDQENIFYKKTPQSESEKVSFNNILNSPLIKQFKAIAKGKKLSNSMNKLLASIKDDSYKNIVVSYRYDDKQINITIHNLLKEFFYNKTLDDKILNGNFTIKDYDQVSQIDPINISELPIRDLTRAASLTDIFYIEFYLKRYNLYQELKKSMSEKNLEVSFYAKQALLTNLFETGAAYLSVKFLTSDNSKQFAKLYYDYKKTRNELAHSAITNREEKEQLITNLELYTDSFYKIISDVYNCYKKEKARNPYAKLPPPHQLDSTHDVIVNKTHKFAKLKHLGICKIIDGKKYLRLVTETKKTYLEIDGSLLSMDYNTFTSSECIIPIEHAKLVEIDHNTNKISPSKIKIQPEQQIDVDQYMTTLIQAQDYFKTFPQYNKNVGIRYFSAITFYDKFGTPTHTEGLKNVIYRRLSQKIIPAPLLESCSLVIPNDIDEPLTILNKEKAIVAKVYLACINYIDGKEVPFQLLKDKTQKEIGYGKLLPKDLHTNELVTTTKEGRK